MNMEREAEGGRGGVVRFLSLTMDQKHLSKPGVYFWIIHLFILFSNTR